MEPGGSEGPGGAEGPGGGQRVPCGAAVAELLACAAAREYDAGRCAAALAALRACVEREGVASLRVRGPFLAVEGEGRAKEGEGGSRRGG